MGKVEHDGYPPRAQPYVIYAAAFAPVGTVAMVFKTCEAIW